MYVIAIIGLWCVALYCWYSINNIQIDAPEFTDDDLVDDLAHRRRYGFVRRN